MGRVLVAGATGELGRHVCAELVARGASVRALVRDEARAARAGLPAAVERVRGDALAAGTLGAALAGVDTVVSSVGASVKLALAGWRGYGAVDVPANRNLIEAAEAAGLRRFVYVSVVHDPAQAGVAYIAAHERVVARLRAAAARGVEGVVVRPTGFFSALAVLVDLAKKGPLPRLGSGQARSNPIADEDLAAVIAEAALGAGRAPEELVAGGPDVLSRHDMNALAAAAVGRELRERGAPLAMVKTAAFLLRPLHPRLSQLMAFAASLAVHDVVAPVRGRRTLKAYFERRAHEPAGQS